jgi:hypothetical protein
MTSPLPVSAGVRRSSRQHTRLTALLRALKARCRLTFSELADCAAQDESAAVSASTLKRAAGGHTLPQEHVVTAYARACGATAEEEREALKRWRAARAEQRGILASLHAPAVRSIRTPADLDAALTAAYERAGAPPLRAVQERATTGEDDGSLLLPLTTLWRITRREARPATWKQCMAFLRGCGIHPRRMGPWCEAWHRLHTTALTEQPAPAPAAQRAARPSWWLVCQSRPAAPLGGVVWLSPPDHPASYDPYGPAFLGHPAAYEPYGPVLLDRPGQRQAAADPAISRVYAGLGPAEQRTVLTAGLTHLVTARGRARRNGSAPDTGIDAIAVRDGKLLLVHCRHADDTACPPTSNGTPAVVFSPRPDQLVMTLPVRTDRGSRPAASSRPSA